MDLDDLTPRQQEIATLVAEGLTNAEIARRLYVQPQTIKNTLLDIYQRVGLSQPHQPYATRIQLARLQWESEHET